MNIKKNIVFNKVDGTYEGFSNYGKGIICSTPDEVASEALVFMLVGLRTYWKYPVGYVLCDKTNADNLHCLISQALTLANTHSIKVRSVTCDGTTTNFSALKSFGCKLGDSLDSIDGSFTFEDQEIYFTPDAAHMLKLARNALCDYGVFIDGNGELIEWKYIASLHEEQLEQGLKFGNKLSNRHINYHRHKMNVSIAAQTISNSVGDAIEFLKDSHHPSFENSSATIQFIRIIDKLFDLLNSRNPHGTGFKRALRIVDQPMWNKTIDESVKYLSELKNINGVPILKTRRKTFVKGLITLALSVKHMASNLLQASFNPYSYILTYKLSQDHLELLFACIRGKNGYNNNPDVRQLKSALKEDTSSIINHGIKAFKLQDI